MSEKEKVPLWRNGDESKSDSSREAWRVFGIMSEFVEATQRLSAIRPAVSIFGSARTAPDSPYYKLTERIARLLSDAGFSVISGGGPGIMEAANRGAFHGKSPSIGLNIQLPHEQVVNQYQDISQTFRHFFARKYMFVRFANAYVVMPGGFGTLVSEGVIAPEDIDLIQVIDRPEEVVEAIFRHYETRGFAPLPAEHEMLLNL